MEHTELVSAEMMDQLDRAEFTMSSSPDFQLIQCALNHLFTPGLYLRKIEMPAMSMVTSKIHNTEHPFIILKGTVSVANGDGGSQTFTAPYVGITKPGTRRILFCHTDVEWMTIHATDKQNVEEIENEIIRPHKNAYLDFIQLAG